MGKYNFDEIIDRTNTFSLKWDFAEKRGKPKDILPFWVADMDFRAPEEVINALIEKSKHGIFGYSDPTKEYHEALKNWYKKRYDYDLNTKDIIVTPGVVFNICTLIRCVTKELDNIIITEPVYYPFKSSILDNNRNVIINELIYKDNKYEFDFVDFEEKIKNNNVKAYILCNPHNPSGKVYTLDDLTKINEICSKYNVFVISDEIHADFVFKPYKFITYAKVASNNYAIVSAPTKTFNIPGLQVSYAIIPNRTIFRLFKGELDKIGYSQVSIMGLVASISAYNYGEKWLEELHLYLLDNINYVKEYLEKYLPKIKIVIPQSTYLVWLDFSKLDIDSIEVNSRIINNCKLWLDDGVIFGESGKNFQRINIATPKSNLKKALDALYNEFKE